MDKKKTIDRIKKLIALSKENPNKNEGESASKKVEELLKKYKLTMTDVNDVVIRPKEITVARPIYKDTPEVFVYSEPITPFFETWIGMIFLLLLKGLFGTPIGWAFMYIVVMNLK